MEQHHSQMVTRFVADMTLRWACRKGDFLLWFHWKDLFETDPVKAIGIVDVWEMRDGDFVTITNRLEDIPSWFALHPTEVGNLLAFQMMQKLDQGYQPGEIMDGPNIWRPQAGDRIAWVGEPRPGQPAVNHVLSLLDFWACALVLGEGNASGIADGSIFGMLSQAQQSPTAVTHAQAAVHAVRQLGLPRNLSLEWVLG